MVDDVQMENEMFLIFHSPYGLGTVIFSISFVLVSIFVGDKV